MASTEWPPRGEAGGPPGPAEPLQEQHPEGAEEHEHELDSASTRTTCTCRWSRSTPAGLGPFLDGSGKDRTDSNQPWAGIYLFSLQARRMSRAAWLSPGTVLAAPARHAPPPLMRSPEKFGVRGIHLPRLASPCSSSSPRSSFGAPSGAPLGHWPFGVRWLEYSARPNGARLPGRRVPHLRPLHLDPRRRLRAVGTVAVRRRSHGAGHRGVVFYIYALVSAILVAVCVQSSMLK